MLGAYCEKVPEIHVIEVFFWELQVLEERRGDGTTKVLLTFNYI